MSMASDPPGRCEARQVDRQELGEQPVHGRRDQKARDDIDQPRVVRFAVGAVQGLRRAYGKPHDTWLVDVITGFLISAPVYWLFTKFLAINLPGLTSTGWI